MVAKLSGILGAYGLSINANKCKLIGKCVSELRNVPGAFSISTEGGICVGCPIGSLSYRQEQLKSIIDEKLQDLEVIDQIHACAAINILRFCINTRISYVHRILGDIPELTLLFKEFDARIDMAIMRIIKFPDKHTSILDVSTLRSLPQARGGLGIVSHTGPVGVKGCMKHRYYYRIFLNQYYPQSLFAATVSQWVQCTFPNTIFSSHLIDTNTISKDWLLRSPANAVDDVPRVVFDFDSNSTDEAVPSQLEYIAGEFLNARCAAYAAALRFRGRNGHSALLLSAGFRGSGIWLLGRGFQKGTFMFSNQEFQLLLSLRLLVPLHPGGKSNPKWSRYERMCVCGYKINFCTESTHYLHCTVLNQGPFHRTHRSVLKALVQIIKESIPPECPVQTEVPFLCNPIRSITVAAQADGSHTARFPQASAPVHIVPDIVIRADDDILYDVTVADPSSPSYIQLYKSHEKGGITAKMREIEKNSKYAHEVPDIVADGRFVPFGMEITGRLGPVAQSIFVQFASVGPFVNESKVRRYNGRLILLLMKWNAKKILHGRKCIRKVPQKDIIINSNIRDRSE